MIVFEMLLAISAPYLLMIGLTRLTYNKWVALLITFGFFGGVFEFYKQGYLVMSIALLSFVFGFLQASKMQKTLKEKVSSRS